MRNWTHDSRSHMSSHNTCCNPLSPYIGSPMLPRRVPPCIYTFGFQSHVTHCMLYNDMYQNTRNMHCRFYNNLHYIAMGNLSPLSQNQSKRHYSATQYNLNKYCRQGIDRSDTMSDFGHMNHFPRDNHCCIPMGNLLPLFQNRSTRHYSVTQYMANMYCR